MFKVQSSGFDRSHHVNKEQRLVERDPQIPIATQHSLFLDRLQEFRRCTSIDNPVFVFEILDRP